MASFTREDIQKSSGNVFADLGFPDADEMLTKSELARQIEKLIAKRGETQAQAAACLGIDQPKVSAIVRGRLRDFSTDRLMSFIALMGSDVQIVVKPWRVGSRGHVSVRVAP